MNYTGKRDAARLLACITMLGMGATAGAATAAPPTDPAMTVLQRWTLGGVGSWDYLSLDSSGRRLFVSRGVRVDVVDTQAGTIIGTIPGTDGVHGIALAEDLRRGFTSNGDGDSVTVFDLDSLKKIQDVKVSGHKPDAILYEPVGKHVFTFNGKSKDATVFDAVTLKILATVPLAGNPEFAADDGAGLIYVNIEDTGQLAVIDSRTLSVKATYPLPGCESPSGLAIDKMHHRLFSVCDGKIMVVTDGLTGKQVARVAIGEAPDAAAYDAKRGLVFSSNGEGFLSVIRQVSPDSYQVIGAVPTKLGARTMALDPMTGRVYLDAATFGPRPPATAAEPRPRPTLVPETFTVLAVGAR